jgi:uncharacterized membrane protein
VIDIGLARALHVLAVVLWIGGVGMVTTVLLPAIRRTRMGKERFELFRMVEHRFAPQARWLTVITVATGLWMLWRLDLWDRFTVARFWWMHAMVLVWLLFTLMLFVIEPFVLSRFLARRAEAAPEATFRRIEIMHRVLLALSLITVFGAVAGAYGVG